ncbi:hypothetical protein H0H93_007217 [Arthromyces matolae]|nr:hypothetical protein H0H93_007217 [Arthromyces matolae]
MPPKTGVKRKRNDEPAAEASTTTRATRGSARKPKDEAPSTSKSKSKKMDEQVDDEQEPEAKPPAKKSKTTKASTKTTTATTSKTTKASSSKKSTTTASSKAAEPPLLASECIFMKLSSFICCCSHKVENLYSDDEVIVQKKSIPETATPTTINEPPISAKPQPQSRAAPNEVYSPERAETLFKNYEDPEEPNVIGADGFSRLCTDADISMDGALPLILAWQFGTKEMMKITADEWQKGTGSLKISNLPALNTAVKDLEDLLIHHKHPSTKKGKKDTYDKAAYKRYSESVKASFNQLYMFCFTLVKPAQSKNIDMETATALWSVLLAPKYPLMAEVVTYIGVRVSFINTLTHTLTIYDVQDNLTAYRAANKDLWSMMLEFCETVNPNLSDYESDGAWPTLLDNFVTWKKNSPTDAS